MILVTATAGLSGSIVMREFARRKAPGKALVRSRTKARAFEKLLTVEVVEERADALDELFAERRKRHESRVYLGTHELFRVQPTTFAEFARRNATLFRGI